MNICTKYGFNNLIISGSYGGHRRHTTDDGRRTTDDGRRTTPWVWHKLPTGELKTALFHSLLELQVQSHKHPFYSSELSAHELSARFSLIKNETGSLGI